MTRTVSVTLTANERGLTTSMDRAASSAKTTAASIKTSMDGASASIDKLGKSSPAVQKAFSDLTRARQRHGDAVRAEAIAEARLSELRAKGTKTTSQVLAAENRLVRAQQASQTALQARMRASKDYDAALEQHSGRLTQNSGRLTQFNRALAEVETHSARIDTVGSSLATMGTTAAVGLGLTVKAAMDWESAWAGVTKTVDGSEAQMAALEDQIRGMARTLPATHEEIAGVAEAAGQLGVQRENIAGFTRTMIDLGESTNLSADQAATSIAQMMNVMGTAPENVGRFGAALVALGNDGASTESDILQMAQRIAGAGVQVGLSEAQVLSYANALSSVGIEAEAGGTAISTTFLRIDQAVRGGGAQLETLARTAGMSGDAFKAAFEEDAGGAMSAFIAGLGKVQASGGDTTKILRDLGITGIRETDALRRLASSGTLLADSLKTGNQAWRENSALVEEAAKRYATTESQARIAWNQIKDSAISGGQAILPVVAQIATGVGSLAEVFGSLPGPVRTVAVALVAATAALGLLGGGALKAITGVAGLKGALTGLGVSAKVAQIAIPGVGIALFATTAALTLWAGQAAKAKAAAGELGSAMQTITGEVTTQTAAMDANVRAATVNALMQSGAADAAKQLGIDLSTVTDAAMGNANAITLVNKAMSEASSPGITIFGGGQVFDQQTLAAQKLSGALSDTSGAYKEQVAAEAVRRAALAGGTGAADAAAKAAGEHAKQLAEEKAQLDATADAAIESANSLLQTSGSQIGMESAIDAATAAAKKNGRTLDANTQKGRDNQTALNSVASATLQYTNQLVKAGRSGDEVNAANERGKAKWIETAVAMGKSRKSAEALAQTLFAIPTSVQPTVAVKGARLSAADAKSVNAALKDIPAEKRAEIVTIAQTKGAKAAYRAMADVVSKEVTASTRGNPAGARQVKAAMDRLHDRLVNALSRGDISGARRVLTEMGKLRDKTVTAKATTSGLGTVKALNDAMNALHSRSVTAVVTRITKKVQKTVNSADGGHIRGPGTETSDSIPVNLSDNEYVIRASSVRKLGVARLDHINTTGTLPGFANGGLVGMATGGQVDIAAILRLIASTATPLTEVIKAQTALAKENREVAAAKRALAGAKGKKAKNKAKNNLNTQLEQQKEATSKLTDAMNQAADAARTMSDQLADPYRSKSNDIGDWLESMRTGATDLAAFQTDLEKLRKLGVSETIVQQIADKGAIAGHDLAQQIIDGGTDLAKTLNQANTALQQAADKIGFTVIAAPKRKADGGPVWGAGTSTSDSIPAMLSNGEFVQPADATRYYGLGFMEAVRTKTIPRIGLATGGPVLDYGRRINHPNFTAASRYGSYAMSSTVQNSTTYRGGDVTVYATGSDPDAIARKVADRQRNALTMAGLRRGL